MKGIVHKCGAGVNLKHRIKELSLAHLIGDSDEDEGVESGGEGGEEESGGLHVMIELTETHPTTGHHTCVELATQLVQHCRMKRQKDHHHQQDRDRRSEQTLLLYINPLI